MTVYFNHKRKRWYYDFVIDGQRHGGYCDDPATGKPAKTKTEAKAIEARARSKFLAGQSLKRPNPRTYTVAQAFAVYMTHNKKGLHFSNLQNYVHEMVTWFGAATPLVEVTHQRILNYITWARQQKIRHWTGGRFRPNGPFPLGRTAEYYWKTAENTRADSTINRYLTCLGKALRMAHNDHEPETGLPLLPIMPKIPKLKEPALLPRPIAPDDLERILAASPQHLADAIRLTVLMGFRRAEVFGLTINHFDPHNRGVWLSHSETKANRDEFIPANEMAYDILVRLVARAKDLGKEHLILYKTGGKRTPVNWRPVKNIQTSWENVLKKVGLKGRHVFHNTKATFVTAIAQEMPAAVVQDLARHRDFSTTMRYIRVADSVRRKAVDSITSHLFFGSLKVEDPQTSESIHRQDSQTEALEHPTLLPNLLKNMVGTAGFEPTTPSPPD
jgi:integrase